MFARIKIKTDKRVELKDITGKIKQKVKDFDIKDGILILNVPHTTAGITINESADPDVKQDIKNEINKVIPFEDNYKHREGNSAAHIKSTLVGCSQNIIIKNNKLLLGRWQGIFFCEFDGPRSRNLNIKAIEDKSS